MANKIIHVLSGGIWSLLIKGKNHEVAGSTQVRVLEIADVKGLNRPRRETNVVNSRGGELVSKFKLCHSHIV
jgi:hypothetical protein